MKTQEHNVTVYHQHEYTSYVALIFLGKWVSTKPYSQVGQWNPKLIFMVSEKKKKKAKRPHYKFDSDQEVPYFKFIVLGSTEEILLI